MRKYKPGNPVAIPVMVDREVDGDAGRVSSGDVGATFGEGDECETDVVTVDPLGRETLAQGTRTVISGAPAAATNIRSVGVVE